MPTPGTLSQDASSQLAAQGDWTLASAPALADRVARAKREGASSVRVDASKISRLDTAGAGWLLDLAGDSRDAIAGLDDGRRALVDAVAKAQKDASTKAPPRAHGLVDWLARIGRAVEVIWRDII